MKSYRKAPWLNKIIVSLLALTILLSSCIGVRVAPVAPSTTRTPSICSDVAAARKAIGELQGILKNADVTQGTKLTQAAAQVDGLLSRYGEPYRNGSGLTETRELRTQVAGALAASAAMLRDWARGQTGETNGAVAQQLLQSAGDEAVRLRRVGSCP